MFGIDLIILAYGVAGSLIASVIVGVVTYIRGKRSGRKAGIQEEKQRFQAKYEAAIESFSSEIQKLITDAVQARSNDELYSSARAIVSTRSSMRQQLSNISILLNSEIDELGSILGGRAGKKGSTVVDTPDLQSVRSIIETLAKTWPAKGPQIDVAYRRLLAEIGLVELDSNQGESVNF